MPLIVDTFARLINKVSRQIGLPIVACALKPESGLTGVCYAVAGADADQVEIVASSLLTVLVAHAEGEAEHCPVCADRAFRLRAALAALDNGPKPATGAGGHLH